MAFRPPAAWAARHLVGRYRASLVHIIEAPGCQNIVLPFSVSSVRFLSTPVAAALLAEQSAEPLGPVDTIIGIQNDTRRNEAEQLRRTAEEGTKERILDASLRHVATEGCGRR
jgi:hypothetical protein